MITVLSERHARTHARRVLRQLREQAGLTQFSLGARLHTYQNTISYRETGKVGLSAEAFVKTAAACGHDVVLIPRQVTGIHPGTRSTGTGWPA